MCGGWSNRKELLWTGCKSHSPTLCATWSVGEKVEKLEKKGWIWALGKKGKGWGKGVLVFVFYFSTSNSILFVNILNYFFPSWAWFSHDGSWWMISLSWSQPTSFSFYFSPCLVEEGEWESSWVGISWLANVNPPRLYRWIGMCCCEIYVDSHLWCCLYTIWGKASTYTSLFDTVLENTLKEWSLAVLVDQKLRKQIRNLEDKGLLMQLTQNGGFRIQPRYRNCGGKLHSQQQKVKLRQVLKCNQWTGKTKVHRDPLADGLMIFTDAGKRAACVWQQKGQWYKHLIERQA